MNIIEKAILTTVFLLVIVTTVWIQIRQIDDTGIVKAENRSEAIDYYVTNFTTTSLNNKGEVTHVLEGAKLIHYAETDTAFIDTPHVIEYKDNGIVQHTYAQTADIGPAGNTITLNKNVKIFEHPPIDKNSTKKPEAREVLATNKLFITLEEEPKDK